MCKLCKKKYNFNLIETVAGLYLYFIVLLGVLNLRELPTAVLDEKQLDFPLTNKVFYYGIIWICGTISVSALYITQKLQDIFD